MVFQRKRSYPHSTERETKAEGGELFLAPSLAVFLQFCLEWMSSNCLKRGDGRSRAGVIVPSDNA